MLTVVEKKIIYSLIFRLALIFVFLFKPLNFDRLVCGTDFLVCVSAWFVMEGCS